MNIIKKRVSNLANVEKGWSLSHLGVEMSIGNNIYRSLDSTPVPADFLFEICKTLDLSAADPIDLFLLAGYFSFAAENPLFEELRNVYLSHRFSE